MALWFPARRLLYASDLFQVSNDGRVSTPATAQELAQVVKRERLDPETVVGMHFGAVPWTRVLSEIARAMAPVTS